MNDFQDAIYDGGKRIWEKSRDRVNVQRKIDQEKLHDFYNGQFKEHTLFKLIEEFGDTEYFQLCEDNITRKLIDNTALIYTEDAQREVEGSERDGEIFAEIADQCRLSSAMKGASRMTKLYRSHMIRVVWDHGKIRLDQMYPHLLDVVTGDTGRDVKAVMVTERAERQEDIQHIVWTPQKVDTLDWRGRTITSEPNPYGIIPFVPFWDDHVFDDFWLPVDDELLDGQELVNVMKTVHFRNCKMQGFAVPVMKGGDPGMSLRLSPGETVMVGEQGDFDFKTPNAPLLDVLESIKEHKRALANNRGLSAAVLSTDPSDQSGIAKIVDNAELLRSWARDVERFQHYEQHLFDVIRTVWNTRNPGRKISEAATLRVDFYDLKNMMSVEERRAHFDWKQSMGIVNQIDALMEENPDAFKTREDALGHLKQLEQERVELAKVMNAGQPEPYFLEAANDEE